MASIDGIMVKRGFVLFVTVLLVLLFSFSLYQITERNLEGKITGRAVSDFDSDLRFYFDFESNLEDEVSEQTYFESVDDSGTAVFVMNTSERAAHFRNNYLRQVSGLPSLINISSTEDFSFSMWIKRNRTGVEGLIYSANLGKNTETANSPSAWFTSSDTPRLRAAQGLIDVGAPVQILPEEGWVHLALTADRDGQAKWYKNGVEVGSSDISNQNFMLLNNDVGGLLLGSIKTASNYINFSGGIDEFRGYSKALSSSEVEELYAENASLYRGCDLQEVYWEDTKVEDEETVAFVVKGVGCEGVEVDIEIRIRNSDFEDEIVDIETVSLESSLSTVSENWIAIYDFRINDSDEYYDTEYYLFAFDSEDESINISSLEHSDGILEVEYLDLESSDTSSNSDTGTDSSNSNTGSNSNSNTGSNSNSGSSSSNTNSGSSSSSSSRSTGSGSSASSTEEDEINGTLRYILIFILVLLVMGVLVALFFVLKKAKEESRDRKYNPGNVNTVAQPKFG